ncbi:RimK family alpha-L-glutamate ligase [Fictibacillus iocasae]|uniref:RimK family alpha-L-glutamate ligase n=1 Tax=Fictibacillus iocasae TaxID=2715437 RepID=A0ABW2NQ13_9BACL
MDETKMVKREGWIVYTADDAAKNQAYIDWFIEEAHQLQLSLHFMERERFMYGVRGGQLFIEYGGKETKLPDFAVVRCIDSLFTLQLENMNIKVFNPSSLSHMANDKARTHQFLASQGIPMVDTLFIDLKHWNQDTHSFLFPVVVKENGGRGGNEVHLVSNAEELTSCMNESGARNWIVQQLAGTPGKDVRVFVVGNKIAGAVLRSSDSDFRANFSLGGRAEYYHLNHKETALVEKIISLLPIGMAGIDFLFDESGNFLFNEIEDVAGSRTLSSCSTVNIVRMYLQHIISTIKNPAE